MALSCVIALTALAALGRRGSRPDSIGPAVQPQQSVAARSTGGSEGIEAVSPGLEEEDVERLTPARLAAAPRIRSAAEPGESGRPRAPRAGAAVSKGLPEPGEALSRDLGPAFLDDAIATLPVAVERWFQALARSGDQRAIHFLLRVLREGRHPRLKALGLMGLVELSPYSALGEAVDWAWSSPDRDLRRLAIRMLGRLDDPLAASHLRQIAAAVNDPGLADLARRVAAGRRPATGTEVYETTEAPSRSASAREEERNLQLRNPSNEPSPDHS